MDIVADLFTSAILVKSLAFMLVMGLLFRAISGWVTKGILLLLLAVLIGLVPTDTAVHLASGAIRTGVDAVASLYHGVVLEDRDIEPDAHADGAGQDSIQAAETEQAPGDGGSTEADTDTLRESIDLVGADTVLLGWVRDALEDRARSAAPEGHDGDL